MPHVDEFRPAARAAAIIALAAACLAGCTDTQRRVPLMAVPGAHDVGRAMAPQPSAVPAPAAGTVATVAAPDALPPATTGVSIGASRRT